MTKVYTAETPLKILVSGCLLGYKYGWDDRPYTHDFIVKISQLPQVHMLSFCPENFSFGTPREFSSIHGGNGFDVLDGKAQVLTVTGKNWTEGAVTGAEAMLKMALKNQVELAILMDISPACGSHVIYLGAPENKNYQQGVGVAAALLLRHNIQIIAQRDNRSLEILYAKLDPTFKINPQSFDYIDDPWYKTYFKQS